MKNLAICSTVFLSLFISCNGQDKKNENQILENNKKMNVNKEAPYNISDEGDGTKFNYDDFSQDLIIKAKKTLEQRKFQFPSDEIFNQRVLEVFGFNLKEYRNSIIALQPSMFPEVALRKDKFIIIQDANANEPDFINNELLYHLNSYIFYKTQVSYVWLNANAKEELYDLVIHFGYNKDKKLVSTDFEKFDFNSLSNVEELIFKDHNSRYELKKQIFDDIENIIYKGSVEDFSYAKEGDGYIRLGDIINKINFNPKEYNEPEYIIAYLFERELRVGIQGDVESYIDKNPVYVKTLKKVDFYNLPMLKDYVEYIYQKNDTDKNSFVINDPDGFTNLRKEKSSSSEILQKIKTGEKIEVLDNSGDWFLVQTQDDKKGYVHKSRIKSN